MKPYASYKPSGVPWLGDVPSHWGVNRLKEICSLRPSNVDKLTVEGQVPVRLCNYVDVYKNERITSSIEFMDATATEEQIEKLSLKRGDVLVTKDSESPWDIAVPTVIAEDIPGLVCGYHLTKLDPVCAQGDYLAWVLRCYQVNLHFALSANGITRYGLGSSALADGNIPVPPSDEQQAIAYYLDAETARIDTLIHEKDELIGLLREAQASAFATTVLRFANATVGVNCNRFTWLQSLPSNWRVAKVKHITLSVDQGISPQCESRPPDDGEWGVLKVGCVNTGDFNPMESKALPSDIEPIESITLLKGDVLISRANTKNLVGRASMADKDYPRLMLSDKHYRLRLDQNECLSQYLVFVLTHGAVRVHIEERATGASASMLNIDRRTIMDLDVPLPPPDVQDEIVREVQRDRAALGRLIAHTHDEITLLKELRAATIADAVLGRIDVRNSAKTIAACA